MIPYPRRMCLVEQKIFEGVCVQAKNLRSRYEFEFRSRKPKEQVIAVSGLVPVMSKNSPRSISEAVSSPRSAQPLWCVFPHSGFGR